MSSTSPRVAQYPFIPEERGQRERTVGVAGGGGPPGLLAPGAVGAAGGSSASAGDSAIAEGWTALEARRQMAREQGEGFVPRSPAGASPPPPPLSPAGVSAGAVGGACAAASASFEGTRVYLHACGRLETPVITSISVSQVCAAARMAFDFSGTQELMLVDKDGEQLTSDAALRAIVARSEAIYVRLSESALHDFERRIDQLQHMQMGHLCDQLASFRQEQVELYTLLENMRLALDKERTARELTANGLKREMEDVRLGSQRAMQTCSDRMEAIEASLFTVKGSVQEETIAREKAGHDVQRRLIELRDTLLAEGKAREYGDERIRYEVEEARRALQLEITDREDAEVRAERSVQDCRMAVTEVAERQELELQELRRHLLDTKQALSVEERERITNDNDLATVTKELRALLQGEVRDRMTEAAAVAQRHSQLETTIESEKGARSQAVAELTQQLSIAVQSIQEEQTLRASEGAELQHLLEAHRKIVDEDRQRQGEGELTVSRLAHDLARRFDEEIFARDSEVSKLQRLIADESSARSEAVAKVTRAVTLLKEESHEKHERHDRLAREAVQSVDTLASALKAEQRERSQLKEDMAELMTEKLGDNSASIKSEVHFINKRLDQLGEASGALESHLKTLRADHEVHVANSSKGQTELHEYIQEVRETTSREAEAREKGHTVLSRTLNQTQQSMEEDRAGVRQIIKEYMEQRLLDFSEDGPMQGLMAKIRSDVLEASLADLDTVREGLTKVVEAAQQERRSRADGDTKLREDCREAIQKEINARIELERRLTADIEGEGRSRMEAVELMHMAIQECREMMESHHEEGAEDARS
eukprot:TRINITY_DN12685_c0_g1_i1.p1 TRINITY_DN12685_c0_g1~~TRINITY_DN12685_c0_g1_i1.p1  ORF type:complete len:828 (-),score=244.28 TRINITY_DN12685_c0_g1_i1:231-2714(-)